MNDILNLSIKELHKGLVEKDFSCVDITKKFLKRIRERQDKINAFITIMDDYALSIAELVDKRLKENKEIDILEGIPCSIKDIILIKDFLCTAGSKILSNYKAVYDATVIKKLKKRNAVILGKTNLDEFAMGSSTEQSYYGPTKNPANLEYVPGGSSGGSAASVADYQAVYSLGTDTGGSVRQPSALCGVVGLKPTYGRVSRFGVIAMASSLDQIGPIAKNVEDVAIVFDAIYGFDKNDATSVQKKEDKSFSDLEFNLKGLKIGFNKEWVKNVHKDIHNSIWHSIDLLEKNGAEIIEIDLKYLKYSLPAYYLIMPAEVSSNLARFDGIKYGYKAERATLQEIYKYTRGEGFGKEVQRRIMLGTYVLSAGYYDAYYKKAQKLRNLILQDYNQAFEKVDCIIMPTTPEPAFKIGELVNDPLTLYLQDIYTVSVNVAGLPAISVPCGKTKTNLPIGMQIIAKHFNERVLLDTAYSFENLKLEESD